MEPEQRKSHTGELTLQWADSRKKNVWKFLNQKLESGKTKVITYWNIFIEINSILSYQKRFFNL